MAYLDTHTRTTSPTKNDLFQPGGRMTALFGVFMGFVKDTSDIQRNGRIKVWISEFGSAPENPDGWITASYCSPFAGATNVETNSKANLESFDGTQTSYGMWMVPPDINNQVLVMFINGEAHRGIWIGCLYGQYMNNMIPGMASSISSHQYPGKDIPVAEYNKQDSKITQPDRAFKPYEKTKFEGLGNQGLINDKARGVTTSSARREAPSNVFGIITPGPVIDSTATPSKIRRKGGSSFIMDDGNGTEYVQLTTKTGAQIKLDETNGFVYLINRDGTAWVQMDQYGNVDIFGATDISMRAQRDVNIRADRNINIEAGQNIFMKAAKDTTEETTTFTYDVTNVPQKKTIPVWKYKGEGKGQGGNIVMQALNNWQSTTKNTAYLTVTDNNMNIKIGNALVLTTVNGGQDYNAKQGIKLTTSAAVDIAAKGNIRVGSQGQISVVGLEDVIVCTSASLNLKAFDKIQAASGADTLLSAGGKIQLTSVDSTLLTSDKTIELKSTNSTLLSASAFGVTSDTLFSGTVGVGGDTKIGGTLYATGQPRQSPASPSPPNSAALANPAPSEPAQSAVTSPPAEIKPLNSKINVLATWTDPNSKFKRNSEALSTTVSRLPTYEPCPEHEKFKLTSVTGYAPAQTEGSQTYQGSGGAGNEVKASPVTNTDPGANNTMVAGDPPSASAVAKDFNMAAYECQLKIHEGVKYVSYLDSVNLPTGGIGHLLRANEVPLFPVPTPISESQVSAWFQSDAPISIAGAQRLIGTDTWGDLTDIRKRACADLCYNMGENRLSKFKNFIAAMKAGNYDAAGVALKNSVWYTQVGKRGPNIITMITRNIDTTGCDKKSTA